MSDVDLAAPERWLESKRRSRTRRLAAAKVAMRRRFTRRSTLVLITAMTFGAAGATAQSTGSAQVSSSSTIVAAQKALGVAADGVVGPQTRRATRRFQRRNGLVVDGVLGPQTLKALGVSARVSSAPRRTSAPSSTLAAIAQCESGGDPTAVSADGLYRGKYQFSRPTWRAMGGAGDPAAAPESVQDRLAAKLYAQQGGTPWPNCA